MKLEPLPFCKYPPEKFQTPVPCVALPFVETIKVPVVLTLDAVPVEFSQPLSMKMFPPTDTFQPEVVKVSEMLRLRGQSRLPLRTVDELMKHRLAIGANRPKELTLVA